MKFSDLSREERKALTDEEWESYKPWETKTCGYCKFMTHGISWWCSNEEAIRARGTCIPGVCLCSFWSLDKKYYKHCQRAKVMEIIKKTKRKLIRFKKGK